MRSNISFDLLPRCSLSVRLTFEAESNVQRVVIRTKSVEFMPFYLSFFLTLSAIAWFGYGLFTKDIYVQVITKPDVALVSLRSCLNTWVLSANAASECLGVRIWDCTNAALHHLQEEEERRGGANGA